MDELKLFWTATAEKQRDYIFEYWNQRNKSNSYSKKLNLAIRERTKILKKQPEIGKEIQFKMLRLVSLKHYSIIYKLEKSAIIIVAFWDNRQDAKKLRDFLKKV
ncbi:plasmid stabilization system protein ParE [Kordia periserrulae]|uniref:Plasmid stabilization system protein ParE n=1 Tax=Kordia periserrulae TaxID=701523 RepID=A0A2T6BXZ6_9FLAO|nr:type II toxin-antitoxin system RelE/ParE family toxin [Kordia periserrulae]PTX60940.1 plasmid stabilization system protein ParE [Kordia periserrulae]